MNNKLVLPLIMCALVFGSGGFIGGVKYQQSKTSFPTQRVGQRQNENGQPRQGFQGNQDFQSVLGKVISSDDTGFTVELADGSSKIVLLTDSTNISKSQQAGKENLSDGTEVQVMGQENSDGSLTAQNVQIDPAQRTMPIDNNIQ